MERGYAFREIIKQFVTLAIFYLLMGIWWAEEPWFQDKIKELSFILGVAVTFLLASLGTSLVSRPVTIKIIQSNKHYKKDETNFSIHARGRTQEHERIVDLQLFVLKKNSIWSKFVSYIIKKFDVGILVEPVTQGIILEAENESMRQDIIASPLGFNINLKDYIEGIINLSNPGQHNKGCAFLIQEDRNYRVSDELIQINPVLTAKNKIAPMWLTLLVKFDSPSHNVNFKWE